MANDRPDKKNDADIAPPTIDFPTEGERVVAGAYSIRISAGAAQGVDIQISDSEWLPCRAAVGFWWFDWTPSETGRVLLVARSLVGKRKWKTSAERICEIVRG